MGQHRSFLLVALTAVIFGVVAEALGGAWPSPETIADLGAGLVLAGTGLFARSRRPQSRVGLLFILAGFAWFLGTLAGSDTPPLAILGAALLTIHRGPIVHAIVAYPSGRPSGRTASIVVIGAYAYAAVVPLARNDTATITLAVVLVSTTLWLHLRSRGPQRLARATAFASAGIMAASLLVGSLGRIIGAGAGVESFATWIYPLGLGLVAILLAADLSRARWAQGEVTRLVVDLGDPPNAGIRGRLAEAFADPSVELAYWLPETGAYVDEHGQAISLPTIGSDRAVTLLEHDHEQIGALIHDPAVLDDPRFLEEVAAAARIALANVRLQGEVRRRLTELEASRRRILEATDAERKRLQMRLGAGVGPQLSGLRELIERASREAQSSGNVAASAGLRQALDALGEAEQNLDRLASGIHSAVLIEQGIGPALSILVGSVGVPVRVTLPSVRLPANVEAALYFVCSEALTNVQKYARASRVDLDINVDDRSVVLVVADDGVGGTDPSAGSGLTGLQDRIEALGGRMSVDSPAGTGTRIVVAIPLDGQTVARTPAA